MDKSKGYIEMCRKAVEIQRAWDVQDGDFVMFPEKGKFNPEFLSVVTVGDGDFAVEYRNDPKQFRDYPKMEEWYNHAFRNFTGGDEWEDEFIHYKKDVVWLPRQDQLQSIVQKSINSPLNAVIVMRKFIEWYPLHYYESFEADWLAFAMGVKYSKIWNRELKKWVKF